MGDPSAVLHQAVEAFLARHPMPGLAAGLVHSGGRHTISTSGFADLENRHELTGKHVFRIASMSKVLTAVTVLRLRDAGVLGLDDPVDDHLTSLEVVPPRPTHPPVTVRHLLLHTSGIAAWGNARSAADLRTTRPDNLREVYGRTLVAVERPGREAIYSNHNYAVLGQLVEDVTGEPFEQQVAAQVLKPLGMSDTRYHDGDGDVRGYVRDPAGGFRPAVAPATRLTAANEARASLADLLRLSSTLLADGSTSLLSGNSRRLLLSPQFRLHPALSGRGLCFAVRTLAGHPLAYVNSFNAMYSGTIQVLPDRGTAVVVLAGLPALRAVDVLADVVLRLAEGLPAPDAELADLRSPLWTSTPDPLGRYVPVAPFDPAEDDPMAADGVELVVRSKGQQLVLGVGADSEYDLVPDAGGADAFRISAPHLAVAEGQSPCPVVFLRDRRGRIDRLVVQSFLVFRRPAHPLTAAVRRALRTPGRLADRATALLWPAIAAFSRFRTRALGTRPGNARTRRPPG